MGILDTAKAFARVGVTKARGAATTTAVKGMHTAADAASKGAASLNDAAGRLRDARTSSAEPGDRPGDGGAPR